MTVVNPYNIPIVTWCDFTSQLLQRHVPPMKIEHEDQWREWGAHAQKVLLSAGKIVPNPFLFQSFQDWAARFNQVIQTL